MTLSEKITALRTGRKLSQGDVAERLDVSRQSVSKWETGQSVPELDKIVRLADLFGVSVDELVAAARDGSLEECWGSGTAAVISPVGTLRYGDEVMEIAGGGIGPLSQKLYDTVTGIQTGKLEDSFGWTVEIK